VRPRFVISLVAVLAGLIVFAGCGGDDDSSSDPALSKSEFLAQGNAICEQGDKEIDAEARQFFTSQQPSPAEEEKFLTDTVIPNVQNQIDELDALSPPAGDEDQVQAIIDSAQSALDEAKSDPSALTGQSGQGDPFAEANRLANAYGLVECGGDSG
jgi:hypothetical protein